MHELCNLGPPAKKTVAAPIGLDRMPAGGLMSAAKSLAIALLAFGCATGGKDGGDLPVDAPKSLDSSQVTIDAPMHIVDAHESTFDAPIVIDAPVMIDAPSGPFCTANNQCNNSGECCLTLGQPQGFCAPGTIIFGECTPF